MELLVDYEIIRTGQLAPLREEANELIAIFVTYVKKVKSRSR